MCSMRRNMGTDSTAKDVAHSDHDASLTLHSPRPRGMSRGLTLLFAVAGGAAVGNLYWAQPLLANIADALGVPIHSAGLLVTVTQIGYALGVFLVVPLGDTLNRRRLIPSVMACSAVALAASA